MIEYRPHTHSIQLPYGELRLNDIPAAIVGKLVENTGFCVPYEDLFHAAWPNYWRKVDRDKAKRNIIVQVHVVCDAARDLGAVALVANVRNVGFTWAPAAAAA